MEFLFKLQPARAWPDGDEPTSHDSSDHQPLLTSESNTAPHTPEETTHDANQTSAPDAHQAADHR